jgi:hypothetical protein
MCWTFFPHKTLSSLGTPLHIFKFATRNITASTLHCTNGIWYPDESSTFVHLKGEIVLMKCNEAVMLNVIDYRRGHLNVNVADVHIMWQKDGRFIAPTVVSKLLVDIRGPRFLNIIFLSSPRLIRDPWTNSRVINLLILHVSTSVAYPVSCYPHKICADFVYVFQDKAIVMFLSVLSHMKIPNPTSQQGRKTNKRK